MSAHSTGGPEDPPVARQPTVALDAVTKAFGEVVANREVSFVVNGGEVLVLVGENGAGKSTLVNLISGIHRPDSGRILFDGTPTHVSSPAEAVALGIGVVHQHYTLVSALSVLDNIALAMPELGAGRIDRVALAGRIERVASELGFALPLTERIGSLDVADQQRVEIVKALIRNVRVLLLDEPTAVLGPQDKARFFAMVQTLKARGVAILLITHKLEDIGAMADRVVVLRAGSVVADAPARELTPAGIIELMIGSKDLDLAAEIVGLDPDTTPGDVVGEEVCRIEDVVLRRPNGSTAVAGLVASLGAGEILAIAGVEGNGQAELVRAIAGVDLPAGGTLQVLGLTDSQLTVDHARAAGLAHIPEDRRRAGIVEDLDVADNFLLGNTHNTRFWWYGLVRYGPLVEEVKRWIAAFGIRTTGPQQRVGALSGGNQQKLVIAREIAHRPKLLIAAYPSRGLDVRTTHFVHEQLRGERDRGAGIVLISGDLDEVFGLADRILVLAAGKSFGPVARARVTRNEIGAFMAGHAPGATPT